MVPIKFIINNNELTTEVVIRPPLNVSKKRRINYKKSNIMNKNGKICLKKATIAVKNSGPSTSWILKFAGQAR